MPELMKMPPNLDLPTLSSIERAYSAFLKTLRDADVDAPRHSLEHKMIRLEIGRRIRESTDNRPAVLIGPGGDYMRQLC